MILLISRQKRCQEPSKQARKGNFMLRYVCITCAHNILCDFIYVINVGKFPKIWDKISNEFKQWLLFVHIMLYINFRFSLFLNLCPLYVMLVAYWWVCTYKNHLKCLYISARIVNWSPPPTSGRFGAGRMGGRNLWIFAKKNIV